MVFANPAAKHVIEGLAGMYRAAESSGLAATVPFGDTFFDAGAAGTIANSINDSSIFVFDDKSAHGG